MPFPIITDLNGHTFADVDGNGLSHREWMANVGGALNGTDPLPDSIVIADTTDGHTYRVVSTNGVLSTVQVT